LTNLQFDRISLSGVIMSKIGIVKKIKGIKIKKEKERSQE